MKFHDRGTVLVMKRENMDKLKRKELIEQYNQIKTSMGVFQIKNTSNGKIFVDSFPNLKKQMADNKIPAGNGKTP